FREHGPSDREELHVRSDQVRCSARRPLSAGVLGGGGGVRGAPRLDGRRPGWRRLPELERYRDPGKDPERREGGRRRAREDARRPEGRHRPATEDQGRSRLEKGQGRAYRRRPEGASGRRGPTRNRIGKQLSGETRMYDAMTNKATHLRN